MTSGYPGLRSAIAIPATVMATTSCSSASGHEACVVADLPDECEQGAEPVVRGSARGRSRGLCCLVALRGGDVAQTLTDLKARDGGDISMSCSPTTVRWLLREGLLDELNLLVHPIAVGEGLARLFPTDEPSIPLELLSAETSRPAC